MSIYSEANRLYDQLGAHVPAAEGSELKLPAITLSHYPVPDTALAAALAVLGVPFRDPAPYTDKVDLDEKGNEVARRKCWWLGDVSPGGEKAHRTEEMFGAWINRERFEKEYPQHPLVWMRAGINARLWWLGVIHGAFPVQTESLRGVAYGTVSIREASVLKASGFAPVAFNGKVFYLQPVRERDLMPASHLIDRSLSLEMTAPEHWMRRVLHVQDEMLKIVRRDTPILSQRDGDQTLLLSADATRKTRDKFHALL